MTVHGATLLQDATINESTAFTQQERDDHGLTGLLPPAVETLDTQVERCLLQLSKKPNDLEQYVYLSQLADDNQTLFYKVIASDPARFVKIVYDPTVAAACLEFGHIYRKPNGIYLSIAERGKVKQTLSHWPVQDVRFICVSTGGRILGLGDLGANGMGIPIGKLQLYTACAAVPPEGLLPVLLDCGTDNEKLLADPLYLGVRHKRPSSAALDSFTDEFVQAVQELYPKCCIHFEDWKGTDAIRLLAKYTDKVSCYNDDIQGTGSVVLAGLDNALKITKGSLKDQRVLFLGAGSAAIGIANTIVSALVQVGVEAEAARQQIRMFDTQGLVVAGRPGLEVHKQPYAHKLAASKTFNHLDLASEDPQIVAAIDDFKPTAIIGVTTVGKLFSKQVVEAMTRHNARPIIFALSNPTENAECTAEQAYTWTEGKAVFAGGIQFDPVKLAGKTYLPGQANNFYIFPSVGLAVFATQAKRVPDALFIEAARALADQLTPQQLEAGMLFPPQKEISAIEVKTAIAVATKAFDLGLARVERPKDIAAWIQSLLYKPEYPHAMG